MVSAEPPGLARCHAGPKCSSPPCPPKHDSPEGLEGSPARAALSFTTVSGPYGACGANLTVNVHARRLGVIAALALVGLSPGLGSAPVARAASQLHMQGRISIDGNSSDFTTGESLFGLNTQVNLPEESDIDSRWQDNDISQIKITWDADSLYIAGEGVINGNNMIILVDVGNPNPGVLAESGVAFDGLAKMTELNSWRRNFVFQNGLRPDFFVATWDGNKTPRLLSARGDNTVVDEVPASSTTGQTGQFLSAATFQGTQGNRSMEFAAPWWRVLGYTTPDGVQRRYVPALDDTVTVLPAGIRYLRIVGVVTGGGDGTGGPDSAPDNLTGHEVDGGIQVTLDNYAILDIDRVDATGAEGPDGLPDFGVEPKSRTTFLIPPPVVALRFNIVDLHLDRPSFAPERGQSTHWTFDLTPKLPPAEAALRNFVVSADVYDMRGNRVRRVFDSDRRPTNSTASAIDLWDGRDDSGALVDGGVYLVRLVLEPDQQRAVKPVAVIR